MQEKINYKTIIDLGFNEEFTSDKAYEDHHGFPYSIITKNLTKKIYLTWEKDTQLCKLVRIDSQKKGNILGEIPITNLCQVKTLVDFFSNNSKSITNHTDLA